MGVKLGLSHTEERRLRVFENRVLMKIFGTKREEVTGRWRRLDKEECARHVRVDRTGAVRVLIARDEGKTPLGTPRRRWENNTKMDLQTV